MKRLLLAIAFLWAMSFAALAQKGRQGFGVDVAYTGSGNVSGSYGATLKYQYGLSNLFRVEPFFTYYFSKPDIDSSYGDDIEDEFTRLSIGANLHTIFFKTKSNRMDVFLLTGVTYSNILYQPYIDSYDYYQNGENIYKYPDDYQLNDNKFGAQAGLGFDYRVNYNATINLTAGYNTATGVIASLGFVYNFK